MPTPLQRGEQVILSIVTSKSGKDGAIAVLWVPFREISIGTCSANQASTSHRAFQQKSIWQNRPVKIRLRAHLFHVGKFRVNLLVSDFFSTSNRRPAADNRFLSSQFAILSLVLDSIMLVLPQTPPPPPPTSGMLMLAHWTKLIALRGG